MIIAYTGLAGSGKTYHMTQTALKLIARGEIVFSRHELEGAYPILDEREMLMMHDCHVFFDEWHQDHSAKEWFSMDEITKHIVTQSRKYGIVIHWSAQHWLYMDSFIRRNTDFVWKHRALFRDPDTGISRIGLHRAIKVAGIEEEMRHVKPPALAKRWIRIKKKVYEAYDSYKPIMLSKSKLTDQEILNIPDPYSRGKIHVSPSDPLKHRNAYLVRDESTKDPKSDSDDDKELVERYYPTDDLDSGMKVGGPTSGS